MPRTSNKRVIRIPGWARVREIACGAFVHTDHAALDTTPVRVVSDSQPQVHNIHNRIAAWA